MLAELSDLYGAPPTQAKNLLETALIKNLAADIGASTVYICGDDCRIVFEKALDIAPQAITVARADSNALLTMDAHAHIRISARRRLLNFLLNCRQKRGLND